MHGVLRRMSSPPELHSSRYRKGEDRETQCHFDVSILSSILILVMSSTSPLTVYKLRA
jgi:hypothetical protein